MRLDRWREVVGLPDDRLPLAEAALLISDAARPGLDIDAWLTRLDDLAAEVASPGASGVVELLFTRLGFAGDAEAYDDPVNSYLDRVIERRRGLPITLAVLAIEVGRRCGVPLVGVGLPGHFVLRDPSAPEGEVIDVFAGGRRLGPAEVTELLRRVAGPSARLTAEALAPAGPRAVLARMLANLDGSFDRRGDRDGLAWVSELRVELPGAPPGDRTQLASRLTGLGRFDLAARALDELAGTLPDGRVRGRLAREALALRARLN